MSEVPLYRKRVSEEFRTQSGCVLFLSDVSAQKSMSLKYEPIVYEP